MRKIEADPSVFLETAPWALAAMIGTLREAASTPLPEVLSADPRRTAVLEAAGLVQKSDTGFTVHPMLDIADAATARSAVAARLSSLKQAVDIASAEQAAGAEPTWARYTDDALLNQGRASVMTGRALAAKVVPALPGLSDSLARAGSRILDVGTGVAGLALVLAREFPAATVTGIDILPRALELGRAELSRADHDVASRIALLLQDVADTEEQNTYDLVWLPVPFLSEEALRSALPRLHRALRPGGWLVAGTNPVSPDPLRRAVAAWTAHLNGGNPSYADSVAEELRAAGFSDGPRFPTVPGGPVLLAARRPGL